MTEPSPETGSAAKLSRTKQKRARSVQVLGFQGASFGGLGSDEGIVNLTPATNHLNEEGLIRVIERIKRRQSLITKIMQMRYDRGLLPMPSTASKDASKHHDASNYTIKQVLLDSLLTISRVEFERRPPLEQMPMWPDILQHYPSARWAFNNVDLARIDRDSKDKRRSSTCIGVVLRYDNGLSEPDEAVGTVEFPLMAEVTVGEDGKATIEYGAVAPPLAVRADLAASRQTPKGEGPSN